LPKIGLRAAANRTAAYDAKSARATLTGRWRMEMRVRAS
jgi:hypothetical protein